MRFLKRCIVWLAVIAVLIVGLKFYLIQFTSSPQETVENFYDAYNDLDINRMLKYVDPAVAPAMKSATSLASALIGGLTGIKFDLGALVDIAPFLADLFPEVSAAEQLPPIRNVRIVSYTPAFAPGLTDVLVYFIPELVNLMADRAVVSFKMGGHRYQVEVVNYGSDGWRLPLDAEVKQIS